MCGICGYAVSPQSHQRLDEPTLIRMRDTLTHRGPDDAGLMFAPDAGLGHRRLSIVDLSGGHQPMSTADGRYTIVYNGEVYNHASIKVSLVAQGGSFATRCDTETVLQNFALNGAGAVTALQGMFAFAIWDRVDRTMTVIRDRFGIKPLYYAHLDDGTLVFGSEIKAIIASGLVRPVVRKPSLPDLLANHATSDHTTLYEGIYRLPGGHWLSWTDGKIKIERYWQLSMADTITGRSDASLVEEYRERLWLAVERRLMADVPLGAFLSGGIDSATITAAMTDLRDDPINTFSVAFVEREANELHYARLVSDAQKTNHHEITMTPREFMQVLPRMIWHEDEPIAHPSSVPLYQVAKLAKEHVKVVLTGEGSDETLAGYNRYRVTLASLGLGRSFEKWTPHWFRKGVRKAVHGLPRTSNTRRRLLRTFLNLPATVDALYFDNFAVFGADRLPSLLHPDLHSDLQDIDPYAWLRHLMDEAGSTDLLDQLLYTDGMSYMHELLMKQDQMSMAASIESRVPFLDHELVEFAATLPRHLKLKGMTTKVVLRRAVEGRLPPEILSRSKMGFPVPVGRWFRTWLRPAAEDILLGSAAQQRGLFNMDNVQHLLNEHTSRHADHSERLWMLLNFEIWHRVIIDGADPDLLGEELAAMAPEGIAA